MIRLVGRATLAIALSAMVAGPGLAQSARLDAEARQQAEILASVGGGYDGPQAVYVARIGERMAIAAGMPGRCTFQVVDSEVVNAFTAPPGCYVYVTRGLLAIMNSEAELAAVLGHELGHVTAKHATKQRNTEVLSGLAAALVGAFAKSDQVGQIAGKVAQLGTLSYSRGQEYEADSLALRDLPAAGYDPQALAMVLDGLQREDAFSARTAGAEGATGVPVWARTHPLTSDRIQRVAARIAQESDPRGLELNPSGYLSALDGMPFGEDSAQGVIRDRSFVHPGLRIGFEAPTGFALQNGAEAVRMTRSDGFLGEFSRGDLGQNGLEGLAYAAMRGAVGRARIQLDAPERRWINGLEAITLSARATSQGRPVTMTVAAYAVGDAQAYQFVTMAPDGQGRVFEPLYQSFRRLTEREAANLGSERIRVIAVRRGDTAETLSEGMAAGGDRLGLFLMLNGLQPDQPLWPGRQVKVIVGPQG